MKIRNGRDYDAREYCKGQGVEVDILPHDEGLYSIWISYPDGRDVIFKRDLKQDELRGGYNDAYVYSANIWYAVQKELMEPKAQSVPDVPDVGEGPRAVEVPLEVPPLPPAVPPEVPEVPLPGVPEVPEVLQVDVPLPDAPYGGWTVPDPPNPST